MRAADGFWGMWCSFGCYMPFSFWSLAAMWPTFLVRRDRGLECWLYLVWFAAVLYSNTSTGPVAAVLGVTRIPLIPLAICSNLGAAGTIDWSGVAALVMMAVYEVGLMLLAEYWMRRRDLLLQ